MRHFGPVLISVLIIVFFANMLKARKLDFIAEAVNWCPNEDKQLVRLQNFTFFNNQNVVVIDGKIIVKQTISGPLIIDITSKRCDISGTGRCDHFPGVSLPNACDLFENAFFGDDLIKQITPRFKCPIQAGEWVWVKPPKQKTEFDTLCAGKIVRLDRNRVLIVDDEGKDSWIHPTDIVKSIHVTSLLDVDDMIVLGDLQEYSILRNLHIRYLKKQIYTYTSSMLIAVNPYEELNIYRRTEFEYYRKMRMTEASPHIFALGNAAYLRLKNTHLDQCIVISGESGAGKTESTKLILKFLASISGRRSWVEKQVIEANPIMEAFGNAKTVRNENSSRFGKYVDIRFDKAGTSIAGARIEQYLLEKSRIVSQNNGERNYHIFYSMLAGMKATQKMILELETADRYKYLNKNDIRCTGRNEMKEFDRVKSAMKTLSFSENEQWEIWQLLAGLLHLGNLYFEETIVRNIEAVVLNDSLNLSRVARFLGLPENALKLALIQRTIFAHGERVVASITMDQAMETRDAFSKAIYGKIFLWIIKKINQIIYKEEMDGIGSIGVLDIFGFENFESNSFEQLCINYANENLQQFFVEHIFKMEQEEYTKDGIKWQHINFTDNKDILEMIGVKSVNIFSLIDEETKFPKGTDTTLLSKLHVTHGDKTVYRKPKYDNVAAFGIQHFAGTVYYNVRGFLEKNRDSFSMDLKELAVNSSNRFLHMLFENEFPLDTNKKSITLLAQFRTSLESLIKTLSMCQPYFIRCVKPNELKQGRMFDKSLCLRQLRYSGMMETARVRKAGFAVRYNFKDFVDRYRILVKDFPAKRNIHFNSRDVTLMICRHYHEPNFYQLGHTKVFLKDDAILEQQRDSVQLASVVRIQRWFRRQLHRRALEKRVWAAIVIQKHWRGREPRQRYQIRCRGLLRLQAVIRSRQLAMNFERLRRCTTGFQAHCRGYLTRRGLKHRVMTNDSKMLIELTIIRRQDEQALKHAGHKNYRELAEAKYYERLASMQRAKRAAKEVKPAPPLLKPKPEKRPAPPRPISLNADPVIRPQPVDERRMNGNIYRSASDNYKPRNGQLKASEITMKSIEENEADRNENIILERQNRQWQNGDMAKRTYAFKMIGDRQNGNGSIKDIDTEEGVRVIENEFDFLNDDPPVPAPRKKRTVTVSRMKNFFEEQSRMVKKIPTKLLSRPVNYYENSSRL